MVETAMARDVARGNDAAGAGGASGTVEAALVHAGRLLARQPLLALAQAREILRVVPGHPHAVLIEGQALRAGAPGRGAWRAGGAGGGAAARGCRGGELGLR
jgi:hypothetical protein